MINKNWVTVSRSNIDEALEWAKEHNEYITNDYGVVGGRTEHYQRGTDYDNIDFFFVVSDVMNEFAMLFGGRINRNIENTQKNPS